MRFEHLVQINDPLMPLLDPLTRAQVWRGLVLRVEDPVPFLPGLDSCTIEEHSTDTDGRAFSRVLDFGSFKVRDRVTLTPAEQIMVVAAASESFPASRLTIRIEEPGPYVLFVRFLYEIDEAGGDVALDDITRTARRDAYKRSDIDTVRRIRELAELGQLD